MTMSTQLLILLLLLAAPGEPGASGPQHDKRADGDHWQIDTPGGRVHIWRPHHFQHQSAGMVVYLHGYFIDVDGACREHWLPEQFAASLQNALFISAESPKGDEEGVVWEDLEQLLQTTLKAVRLRRPPGPLVVVGHSGAFRTIVPWLNHPRLDTIILLDGLYSLGLDYFLQWLKADAHHRLILVGFETHPKSLELAARFPVAVMREELPEKFSQFTPAEFQEQLIIIRSQFDHMEMVTQGQVLPLVLRLSPLRALPTSAVDPRGGIRQLLTPPPALTSSNPPATP